MSINQMFLSKALDPSTKQLFDHCVNKSFKCLYTCMGVVPERNFFPHNHPQVPQIEGLRGKDILLSLGFALSSSP
jgi:hypothetical protein